MKRGSAGNPFPLQYRWRGGDGPTPLADLFNFQVNIGTDPGDGNCCGASYGDRH